MKRAKDFWNYILEDDPSVPYGGTAFRDETLGDFIEEDMDFDENTPMNKVNRALRECGIKTIKYAGYKSI